MENKILKFAIIGTSDMANYHMKSVVSHPNTELVAICDIHPERITPRAIEHNVKKTFTDYKEMLKDPEIDAVIVCTPDFVHEEMTVEALKAG